MLVQHSRVELRVNDDYASMCLGGLILLAIMIDRVRKCVEARGR